MLLSVSSNQDFILGLAVGLVPVVCYSVWNFLSLKSCADVQAKAKAPIKKLGNDNEITIFGFQKKGEYECFKEGVCDGSPYVARVECYIRLIDKPRGYVKATTMGMSENPRRMAPFANVFGTMVDDSARILNAIQSHYGINPDEGLSKEQVVQGYLIRKLLTGSTSWVREHFYFGTEEGRVAIRREVAKFAPAFMLPLIIPHIIKKQHAKLDGFGISKVPHEEIIEMGKADLRTLNTMLGSNMYILGTNNATVYDTDVYSFLGQLFYDTTQPTSMAEWVEDIKKELPKLVNYTERMRSQLFPELQKTKTN